MEQELPGAGDQQLSEGATAQGAEGGEAGESKVSSITFKLANNITVHASSDNVPQENLQKLADLLTELHPPTDADSSPRAHIVLGAGCEASLRYVEHLRNTSQRRAEDLGAAFATMDKGFDRLRENAVSQMVHLNPDYLVSLARPPANPAEDLAIFNALGADALEVDYSNIEHRMAAVCGQTVHNIFIDEVMPLRTNPRPRRLSRAERKLRKLKRMSGNLK